MAQREGAAWTTFGVVVASYVLRTSTVGYFFSVDINLKYSSYICFLDIDRPVPGDTFQRDRTLRTQPSLISTSLFFSRPKSRAAGLYVALSTPGPPVMPFRGWLCSDASSTEALVQPEACCEKFHAFPASPHRAQLCSPPTGRLYCSHFCLRSSCEFLRTKGKRTT